MNPAWLPLPRWAYAVRALLLVLLVGHLLQRIVAVSELAVRQARAQEAARALQTEAQWRCRVLRPTRARQRCLALLHDHPPADAAALQALLADAAAPAP
jgi:hypothetical protein